MVYAIRTSEDKVPPALDTWEEIKGTLVDFKKEDGSLILTFSARIDATVSYSSDFEEKLKSLKGKRIGILSTDSSIEKYRIRLLSKEDCEEGKILEY